MEADILASAVLRASAAMASKPLAARVQRIVSRLVVYEPRPRRSGDQLITAESLAV
jgi:hypothetical protein